jgi:hypothetical protein
MKPALVPAPVDSRSGCGSNPQVKNVIAPALVGSDIHRISAPSGKIVILGEILGSQFFAGLWGHPAFPCHKADMSQLWHNVASY